LYPSGSKSDRGDTDCLLELLLHHRDHLSQLEPDTAETRLLQMLVEQRRRLVDEKTACSNRLSAWLKMYFPQVLDWIDDIDSPLGCDLLQRWPTLAGLQRAHPGTLRRFFHEHNCRSGERIQQRIDSIYEAKPAIHDTAMLEAGPLMVRHFVTLCNTLRAAIIELDERIEKITRTHPERALFADLPGAGSVLLPRLIVAFGTQRERFASAGELASYSGIAPVTEQSGQTRWVHFRLACPKFLRQTFHEFASHSIQKCAWARAFYELQREKGKKHHAAVRALAFKWIRILFRCWQQRTPYDEAIYLRALQTHHSPLPTRLQWKTIAGFHKLSLRNS
jgi:transposase